MKKYLVVLILVGLIISTPLATQAFSGGDLSSLITKIENLIVQLKQVQLAAVFSRNRVVKKAPTPTPTPATGTYYVDCASTANDNNAGTSATKPWHTIGRASCMSDNPQCGSFKPGDTILFKRGCTWTGEQLTINTSGTAGKPITIADYGTGNLPIIQGSVSAPVGVGNVRDMINVNGKSYLTFQNLEIRYAENPVVVNNSSNIVLNNLNIHDNIGYGAILLTADSQSTTNNTVSNTTIYNTKASTESGQIGENGDPNSRGHGIFMFSNSSQSLVNNNIFTGNTIYNNGESGIDMILGSNNRFSQNKIYNNGSSGISLVSVNGESNGNIVENNLAYNNGQTTDDVAGIDLHRIGSNNIVRYNAVYNTVDALIAPTIPARPWNNGTKYGNVGIRFDSNTDQSVPVIAATGNQVYYNLIVGGTYNFMNIRNTGLSFFNNILHNSSSDNVRIHNSKDVLDFVFKNNILTRNSNNENVYFVRIQDAKNVTDPAKFNNNMYYSSVAGGKFCALTDKDAWCLNPVTTLADWQSQSGFDKTNSLIANPQFSATAPTSVSATNIESAVSSFKLNATSPALDKGATDVTAGLSLAQDYFSQSVPYGSSLPDLGFSEIAK